MHDHVLFARSGQLDLSGFEVFVVTDATAAACHPELEDGYQAAVVNFNFIASKILTIREAVYALH